MALFTPGDIDLLEYPAWLTLSSDGRAAAYALHRPDAVGNRFASSVHVLDTAAGTETATLPHADLPQFAPVGGILAFLQDVEGEGQIILRLPDGTTRQLTRLRHGVTRFGWSSDGTQLVFEAPLWPGDFTCPFSPRTVDEKRAWLAARENAPVVIEDLMYKFDETYGVVDGSVPCIGVVEAATGAARLLTHGGMHCHSPAFSPDGQHVAFYGRPYGHHKARRDEVFILPLAGGEAVQLTTDSLCAPIAPPAFTQGGGHVIYAAYKGGDDIGGFLTRLFKVPVGGGEAVCIFEDDMGIDNMPHGRVSHGVYNPVFQPSRCGRYIYYTSAWMGSNGLYRIRPEGEAEVEQIPTGDGSVHCFCPPVGDALLYSRADFHAPCQLYMNGRPLTALNTWTAERQFAPWRELWVDAFDGKFKVQGWVLLPPGGPAGEALPAILNVHGGPTISYVRDFSLEAQAQAASGHAVLLCNPRGSSGYGLQCTDSALAWGQEAMDDLFAFVDAACDRWGIDPGRVGITGGSYGGYMTIKLIGRTGRFRAACAQRALCNTATSYGTGDMGFVFNEQKMPEIGDFLLGRVKTSYINQIDRIHTPLLLLHGVNDYRCSFEQAEQMFIAMKDRRPDIPVRLVAFPGENHGVSRTGRPESQRVHMQELIDWFAEYLAKEDAHHE